MIDSLRTLYRRITNLAVDTQLCRECDHPVAPLETICPFCGIRNPVYIPRWIGTVMLFLLVLPVIR